MIDMKLTPATIPLCIMKTITILPFAVALGGALAAQEAAPAPASEPQMTVQSPSSTPDKNAAEALVKEILECFSELSDALNNVTDKTSADAAAARVEEIAAALKSVQEKGRALGDPTPEVQEEIKQKYASQFEETLGKFLQASIKASINDFYGSERLLEVFQELNAGFEP